MSITLLFASWGRPAEPASSPPEMLGDAELAAVFFLDIDRGWAVGDRGVILATEDGGRRWTHCDSPVNCRLESVMFVDAQRGWAVGGWTHPYTHKTSGVVLRTENGGRRWTRVSTAPLPKLCRVHFVSPREGWAAGSASPLFPSGCFHSVDGGQTWQPIRAVRWGGWTAMAVPDAAGPALVGRGQAGHVAQLLLRKAELPRSDLRDLKDMCFSTGELGWVVGDGGLVYRTDDAALHWHEATGLPSASGAFDFRAVAGRGTHVWAAGVPGTRVLYSADGGETWDWFDTGGAAGIEALHFVSDTHGWAVGPLGTILATRDGGRSWIRQRGSSRVAVLGVFGQPDSVPLELFARLSGDEGYLAAVELVGRRDVETSGLEESTLDDRTHEAVVAVGGSAGESAWKFPLRQAGLQVSAEHIVFGWDTVLGGNAVDALEAHLVKRIRQWRPEVIVTDHPFAQQPLTYLVNQAVLAATVQAADAAAFPGQAQALGLGPWQARKVLAHLKEPDTGTLVLETSRIATRLGGTVADYAARARGLVRTQWTPPPRAHGFRLLVSDLPRETARRDFFSGLTVAPGDEVRRRSGPLPATDLASLSQAAQKRRNTEQVLALAQRNPATFPAQLNELLRDLDQIAAGEILYRLSHQLQEAGQVELSAETLLLLVERYPDHPVVEAALIQTVGLLGSQEVRWGLLGGREPELFITAAATGHPRATPPPRRDGPLRADRLATLWDTLERTRPALYADPRLRAAHAADHRRRGRRREALRIYQQLADNPALGGWNQRARGELWQLRRADGMPRSVVHCLTTDQRPRLDGRADEEFWQKCDPVPLALPGQNDAEWPASVRLAYDREYLYLAIVCQKVAGIDYPQDKPHRTRDEPLERDDRVELFLDIDRDYLTFYHLAVDSRGRTAEHCAGSAQWNPEWFVAADSDTRSWSVEAAINLLSLTGEPIEVGDIWSLGVQRVVPDAGFQSWTHPAAIQPRSEGFGYLEFR